MRFKVCVGEYLKWYRYRLDVSDRPGAGINKEFLEYRVLFHITLFPRISNILYVRGNICGFSSGSEEWFSWFTVADGARTRCGRTQLRAIPKLKQFLFYLQIDLQLLLSQKNVKKHLWPVTKQILINSWTGSSFNGYQGNNYMTLMLLSFKQLTNEKNIANLQI
jgi:hypothetical protein